MTIYMLDDDPYKTAEYLDDNSLNRMIIDIAQVLCNVHHRIGMDKVCALNVDSKWEDTQRYHKIPLKKTFLESPGVWADWARKCKANYSYLVGLGIELLCEQQYRFFVFPGRKYKQIIMDWAYHNIPDLPEPDILSLPPNSPPSTPFPLVMPKKYQVGYEHSSNLEEEIHWCYRNYYQAKLDQHLKKYKNYDKLSWTHRQRPQWLELNK